VTVSTGADARAAWVCMSSGAHVERRGQFGDHFPLAPVTRDKLGYGLSG
jgi:hypothetical protein